MNCIILHMYLRILVANGILEPFWQRLDNEENIDSTANVDICSLVISFLF